MGSNEIVHFGSVDLNKDGRLYFGEPERSGDGAIRYPFSLPQDVFIDFSENNYLKKLKGVNVPEGSFNVCLKQTFLGGDISVTKYYDGLYDNQKVIVPKREVDKILDFLKSNSEIDTIVS
ncbi:MAG: hypothetical protein GQ477_01680 [Nanohaloarchaea archaeon]|nr:hypothetical protein [Candidatus Nanohaloarchaea archaeon]